MFIDSEIVAIFFRLVNFIALIGVGFFLFKKYGMPDLLLSIARKQNKQDSLYAQQIALEKQQHNLDKLLKEESLQCQEFRAKIDVWEKDVTLERERYEKKRHDITQAVIKQKVHNALQEERQQLKALVTDALITDMQKSVTHYFQDPHHGNEYLNSILHFMNERSS